MSGRQGVVGVDVNREPLANGAPAPAPAPAAALPDPSPAARPAAANPEPGGADERFVSRLSRPPTPGARASPLPEDAAAREPARRDWGYHAAAAPRHATACCTYSKLGTALGGGQGPSAPTSELQAAWLDACRRPVQKGLATQIFQPISPRCM